MASRNCCIAALRSSGKEARYSSGVVAEEVIGEFCARISIYAEEHKYDRLFATNMLNNCTCICKKQIHKYPKVVSLHPVIKK
jgi:hypothetical protein